MIRKLETNETVLWSKRWSVAKGWHWQVDRYCFKSEAQGWLEVFKKDEPEIEFVISNRTPK